MLTAAILAIAIIGVFSIYASSIALTDMAGAMTQVTNVARYKMEALYAQNFDTLNNFDGQTFDLSEFSPESLAVKEARGVYKVDNYGNNLKKVTISISYRTKGDRAIGEDVNLSGTLDAGEDANADARLSSPIDITTIIARKN